MVRNESLQHLVLPCRVQVSQHQHSETPKTERMYDQRMLPIVITDAMHLWKNQSMHEFERAFGHHRILARRTRFAAHRDQKKFGNFESRLADNSAVYSYEPHVLVSEFLTRVGNEHIVMFDIRTRSEKRKDACVAFCLYNFITNHNRLERRR